MWQNHNLPHLHPPSSTMSRVTRSRTFAIAEDETATALASPLPPAPGEQAELLEITSRMDKNTGYMEDPLEAQVKGLKAAYKSALGVGKKLKKAKSRRKDREMNSQETLVDEEAPIADLAIASPALAPSVIVPKGKRELREIWSLDSNWLIGSVPALEETDIIPPQEPVRTTRHQAAKAQAGQYTYVTSDFIRSSDSSVVAERFRDLDFISLFSGRPTAWQRTGKVSTSSRRLPDENNSTNHVSSLAKECPFVDHVETVSSRTVDILQIPIHDENNGKQEEPLARHAPAGPPAKTLAEIERACGSDGAETLADVADEDSFVRLITSRSPAKPVSRIEDSVEALDRLEEALDALEQARLAENIISPVKSKPKSRLAGDSHGALGSTKQVDKAVAGKQSVVKGQAARSGYATMRVKSAPKQTPALKKAASMNFKPAGKSTKSSDEQAKTLPPTKTAVKRPVSLLPPTETKKPTRAPTGSAFALPGDAVALKLKKQREVRVAQRQSSEESHHGVRVVSGPKIKSSKPPTKPTFELPGDEVSRRKRAAHEARLRAQEEEERKRREFKARPIRNSAVPSMVPRETVASRARQSRGGIEDIEDGNLSVSKRGSNIGAHRLSIAHLALANSSAPRSKGTYCPPARKPSPTVTGPSMTGLPLQRTASVTDSGLRRRAKEIYNRDSMLTVEMEREKRDREAAAKRVREEAAERGRQASREWAERQMAKKTAEVDKGMGAGYGPGGQLGLSHD